MIRPFQIAVNIAACIVALLPLAIPVAGRAASDADLAPLAANSPLAGRLGAVGMILAGSAERPRALGTGFLVTPCHVLTAAHVLARSGFPVETGMPARFVPSSGERAFALGRHAVEGRVVVAGTGFVAGGASATRDPAQVAGDWALLELEAPLAGVDPIHLLYPGASVGIDTPVSAIGYAASASMTYLYAHENCRRREDAHSGRFASQMLLADCAVRPGMSGGPLLLEGSDRSLIAAGVLAERIQMGQRVLAVAVPVPAFAATIAPLIRQSQRCAAGAPFAVPPGASAPDARGEKQ